MEFHYLLFLLKFAVCADFLFQRSSKRSWIESFGKEGPKTLKNCTFPCDFIVLNIYCHCAGNFMVTFKVSEDSVRTTRMRS